MADVSRIRELVNRAVTEPAFGRSILENPEAAAGEYGLTTEQVHFIQQLNEEGVLTSDVEAHINLSVY
jgi:hypothetical protein